MERAEEAQAQKAQEEAQDQAVRDVAQAVGVEESDINVPSGADLSLARYFSARNAVTCTASGASILVGEGMYFVPQGGVISSEVGNALGLKR